MDRTQQIKKGTLERLVEQAKAGDKQALEDLVLSIQDRVYGLSLRMLYHPADAEDATQEILVKIITRLDRFEGRSSFSTWAYRVASNHLLSTHKRRAEMFNFSFQDFEHMIDQGTSHTPSHTFNEAEMGLMLEEMKLSCTQGMLLCLSREVRLAFVLGEIFGANSEEGAEILDITPVSFRQRLSRGRKQIREFMTKNCSLVNSANPCQCAKALRSHIKSRWIDPENPLFTTHPCHAHQRGSKESRLQEIDELGRVTALFRTHPDYSAPEAFVGIVKKLLDSGKFRLLNNH